MLKTIYNNCAGIDVHKKIKKHNKFVKNTDDMISYLTKLGYNITLAE